MKGKAYNFHNWPETRNGNPIFECTEDAIYYAHLVEDIPETVEKLTILRRKFLAEIRYYKSKDNPNYDRLMTLAVKAQFYRECLEEIDRILRDISNNEK